MAEATELDLEQEILRVQMDDSRDALAQKIELLEEKVTETVQNATATVAEATASVMETVQTATASVTGTVDSVTNAVQGTVDSVRQSVEGTVDSVKDAFDISRQFNQHPWLMMAGAAAVGYFGGVLLQESRQGVQARWNPREEDHRGPRSRGNSYVAATAFNDTPMNGFHSTDAPVASAPNTSAPSWFDQIGQTFAPEIKKLQSLAVGTLLSSVRDIVVENVPAGLQPQVTELIDGVTEKLGGQCIHGSPTAGYNEHNSHVSR